MKNGNLIKCVQSSDTDILLMTIASFSLLNIWQRHKSQIILITSEFQ